MEKGFDHRIISYAKVHDVHTEDFDALVTAIDPKPRERILDGCAGYGEVTSEMLQRHPELSAGDLFVLDQSEVQLDRARKNLPEIPTDQFVYGDMRQTDFPDNHFDVVVIKMGVHEVPKDDQPKIFQEVRRILKPGGRFVMWELALDEDNQELFQDVIRKKDTLAGFDSFVTNRYFQRLDELLALFSGAKFSDIEVMHMIMYTASTKARAEELVSKDRKALTDRGELKPEDEENLTELGKNRAQALTDYVRSVMPEEMKEKMHYVDEGDDIRFTVRKAIIRGKK